MLVVQCWQACLNDTAFVHVSQVIPNVIPALGRVLKIALLLQCGSEEGRGSLQVFQVQCYKTPLYFSPSLTLSNKPTLFTCWQATRRTNQRTTTQLEGGTRWDYKDLIGPASGCSSAEKITRLWAAGRWKNTLTRLNKYTTWEANGKKLCYVKKFFCPCSVYILATLDNASKCDS